MTAILTFAKPGDAIVYTTPLYGGTQHLIHEFLEAFGIQGIAVQAGATEALDRAISETSNLGVVLIETPANPTMTMTDIRRAVEATGRRRADGRPLVMVDNTFLGPVFQHPLALGADIALYSATKYFSGFSDVVAGVALAREEGLIRAMKAKRGLFGNILPPDECWLLDSRLPTLVFRMNRQSKNAQRIAEKLVGHPKIGKVYYPTLFDEPEQIRIRLAQCDFPGGLFSIELRGGKPAAYDFLRHIRIGKNAVSLGGMETLVCHPKTTTHSSLTIEEMQQAGITDGLVRISVGVEDWRDLLADFEQALNQVD